ncbi:MAG: VTT domain-containing protein, partial [Nannocystaceae bacterium]|nr:VTT domain-containing protein [Nannocystaceae bacterium]
MTSKASSALLWIALFAAILIPFALWGDDFEAYGASLLDHAAPSTSLAVVLIALLAADLVLPVPSSILAVGVGAVFGTALGTAIVAVGLSLGAWVGYELGRSAGQAGVSRWIDDAQRQRLETFARKHGVALLVALRAVPVLAEASVVVAGTSRMPRARVLVVTTAANLAVALVYATA